MQNIVQFQQQQANQSQPQQQPVMGGQVGSPMMAPQPQIAPQMGYQQYPQQQYQQYPQQQQQQPVYYQQQPSMPLINIDPYGMYAARPQQPQLYQVITIPKKQSSNNRQIYTQHNSANECSIYWDDFVILWVDGKVVNINLSSAQALLLRVESVS